MDGGAAVTVLDQSLVAAVTGLEIAAVHAAGKLDLFIAYDGQTGLFSIMVCRDHHTVADVQASRLGAALILADQAVHNASLKAVAA